MTVSILRLEDARKLNLRESDLVKARSALEVSPTIGIEVPGIDLPPGQKCTHGVYLPHGEKVALYCSICNPYVLEISEALQSRLRAVEDIEEDQLLQAVESGHMSEEAALKRLKSSTDKAPINYDINKAYALYNAHQIDEGLFWQYVLRFVTATVKRQASQGSRGDRATLSNIEDAITETALQVWQQIKDFDASRSSFRTFVTMCAISRVRDLLRRYKTDRGGFEHIQLDESKVATPGPSVEDRLLFKEWLAGLEATDRKILQMLKDGLTQAEIGEALDITQQAVAKRLNRIRTQEKPPFRL